MFRRTLFGCASMLLLMSVAGCGGGEQKPQLPPVSGGGGTASTAPAVDKSKWTADISGKVIFEGTAPKPQRIQMSADPFCASNVKPQEAMTEEAVVNADGTLQNVIVYIKSGIQGSFPTPSEPVVIDQKDCRYHPHVFTLMVNQPFKIKNSDSTLHNIHAWAVTNTPFNIGQPVQNMETTKMFDKTEMPLPIRCDVHKWMSAFVGVFNHPFHTVTRDSGTYDLKLPPGKYEVVAWHEKFGIQTQTVEVAADEKKEVNFTFKETKTE